MTTWLPGRVFPPGSRHPRARPLRTHVAPERLFLHAAQRRIAPCSSLVIAARWRDGEEASEDRAERGEESQANRHEAFVPDWSPTTTARKKTVEVMPAAIAAYDMRGQWHPVLIWRALVVLWMIVGLRAQAHRLFRCFAWHSGQRLWSVDGLAAKNSPPQSVHRAANGSAPRAAL